jgi:hypothetical protein
VLDGSTENRGSVTVFANLHGLNGRRTHRR